MNILQRRLSLLPLLFVFLSGCLFLSPALADTDENDKRNKLIAYMLYKQLPAIHFSDKLMNDELSVAAFGLFIKQLDNQKRFLLQEDFEILKKISTCD